jgi:hypothetical protein
MLLQLFEASGTQREWNHRPRNRYVESVAINIPRGMLLTQRRSAATGLQREWISGNELDTSNQRYQHSPGNVLEAATSGSHGDGRAAVLFCIARSFVFPFVHGFALRNRG